MTKRQRLLATLRGKETDRAPFSAYMHSTVHQRTPELFARFTVDFYRKYDPDYVKVMYDENYDTPVNHYCVGSIDVWRKLERFDPRIGAFGRQLEALKRIRDAVGPEVPVIQTVFSPFHIAQRLATRRILSDWQEDREAVLAGMDAIAVNSARFAEACLEEAGVDGFFYGAYGCESGWMPESQYKEMVMPSDGKVMKALRKARVLILHIHGEKDAYFDLLSEYECDAVSWEDRLAGPPVAEARRRTGRCLVGGIDHYAALKVSPQEIVRQGKEALQAAGGKGIVLAPGCTFFDGTPPENILALKEAVSA